MKLIKTISIALLMCYAQNCFSQIDVMTEDEDEDLKELSEAGWDSMDYGTTVINMVNILKNPEVGPLGNWMGDKLLMMNNPRFAEAPKEYKAAYTVKVKTLKIETYNALLARELSCSERKDIMESYIMFLGTIFLDTFGMDYFADRTEYTYNEFINIYLASIDASVIFATGQIGKRRELEKEIEYFQRGCNNDLNNVMVTNCNSISDDIINRDPNSFPLGLKLLHPLNIASLLTNLQSSLSALPCND